MTTGARGPLTLVGEEVMPEPTVVSIGSFDGVHRGHRSLIAAARQLAQTRADRLVVVTFDPHPAVVLRGQQGRFEITPLALKLEILADVGVEAVRVLAFDQRLAALAPLAFLEEEVAGRLRARAVVVGYNFTFGAGGRGTVHTLREWAASRGVAVEVVAPVTMPDGQIISSSWIRGRIGEADLQTAARALGRPFWVAGPVVAGQGRGSGIGFPTANVALPDSQLMPPYGVYAGWAEVEGTTWGAVANWGVRPTFAGGEAVLEVHVLDRQEDFRGRRLRFAFGVRLREERRFASVTALVAQIAADAAQARRWLAAIPRPQQMVGDG